MGEAASRVISRNRKALLLICLIGFAIRLAFLLFFDPGIVFPDHEIYWGQVRSLIDHGTFHYIGRDAIYPPLTAIVLASIVMLTGSGILGAKLLLVVVSAITVYFVTRIALLFHPSRLTLWIAGIAAAFYPFFVFFSALICSENLFLMLLSIFFFCVLSESGRSTVFSGLFAGLSHLTRPTLLPFLPLVWIWQRFYSQIQWKYIVCAVAILLVVIVPWGVRNYYVLGKFVIGTTGFGHVFYEGNNPYNDTGGVMTGDRRRLEERPEGLSELESDKWERDRAIEYIKSDPARFFVIGLRKFLRFWSLWPNASDYSSAMYRWISLLSFGPVLVLSLLSIPLLWGMRKKTILIWAFVGYYSLLHVITLGSLRYRLPLEPLLIALAAATLAHIISKIRGTVIPGTESGEAA
jgi:4-amino-4-deoxy-L-arabinose transferase-like glycosyltransferase